MSKKVKILFNVFADEDNVNAQSLNARDIALRLNPEKFESYLFARNPDTRLLNKKSIHLIKLYSHLKSLVIAYHMIFGNYDIIFYPADKHLMTLYENFIWLGKKKKLVYPVEGIAKQVQAGKQKEKIIKSMSEADACFALSSYVAKTIKKEFNINSKDIIPVGVNTSFFTPVNRNKPKIKTPVKILYVGTIQPRKQIHLIFDLAKKIKAKDVEFHIVGNILDKEYYDKLIKQKKQENLKNVHFHGKKTQEEVKKIMQNSDIFILPSRLEGIPKVTLEAASSELPCIIFSDYKTPSVINNKTGFQVKTFDEMLEKLELLIKNKNLRLRMGIEARKHAKKFDWDIIAKKWEKVFENITND